MNTLGKLINQTVEQKQLTLINREQAQSINTDHDHTPYGRYYRSVPGKVIVTGNEAGWRLKHNHCYEPEKTSVIKKSTLCFVPPSKTVFPCYNSEPTCQQQEYNKQCLISMR